MVPPHQQWVISEWFYREPCRLWPCMLGQVHGTVLAYRGGTGPSKCLTLARQGQYRPPPQGPVWLVLCYSSGLWSHNHEHHWIALFRKKFGWISRFPRGFQFNPRFFYGASKILRRLWKVSRTSPSCTWTVFENWKGTMNRKALLFLKLFVLASEAGSTHLLPAVKNTRP